MANCLERELIVVFVLDGNLPNFFEDSPAAALRIAVIRAISNCFARA